MDIEQRLFDKLDSIEHRLTDLCTRLTVLETEYKSHLEDLQREQDGKIRRRDFIIVIVGISLGLVEVLRSLDII